MSAKRIIIVDENDEVIGCRERESFRKEHIYRVSALWITNSRGDILIARRHRNKSHDPLKWGPSVAGTNEEGETYYQNVAKEAKEELGLKNIAPKLGPKMRMRTNYNYFTQFYTLKIDKDISEFKIQEDEVEEIKWISKENLRRELKSHPENFTPGMRIYRKLFLG